MQSERPEQRTKYGAKPADDGRHQRLDRYPGAESDGSVYKQVILRIESAGERGQRRRDHDRLEFDGERIDAERAGGRFVLAHRDEIGAETMALDRAREKHRDGDESERDPQIRQPANELEIRQ